MMKLRKIMMGIMFALIVVMGVNAGTGDVKAASTKDFKGNLNVTYENSEGKSKITFKKVDSKKVSVKIVVNGLNQGSYTGTVTSKNTINMKLDGGEKIDLKWKGKISFTAKAPKNGFSSESIQMARLLCDSLNNTKYTQVKESDTVYYASQQNTVIKLKGNNIVVKGNLTKGTKYSSAEVKGKISELKKATRTFKLDKSFKACAYDGYYGEYQKLSQKEMSSYMNGKSGGLYFVITIKNGKVTRIDFYS